MHMESLAIVTLGKQLLPVCVTGCGPAFGIGQQL
jgi:hypothetical protein